MHAVRSAPNHVPPSLVRDFNPALLPGADVDPMAAMARQVQGWPEIFYGTQAWLGDGAWVMTTHDLIREVFQDAALFSSIGTAQFSQLAGEDWPLLPLEADPPDHGKWRMLLNPIFAPARMRALEGKIRDHCIRLMREFAPDGRVEFVSRFAYRFPVTVFLEMFGLPLTDAAMFLGWEDKLLRGPELADKQEGARAIVSYLRDAVRERLNTPRDDLISYIVDAKVDGRRLSEEEMLGVTFLLYSAGLDTVANVLGFVFRYLAENVEAQERLRARPSEIPQAIEELLRAYPIIITSRVVTRDVTFHGVAMSKGDRVALPTMLAGRDAAEFDNPDSIDFGRQKTNHITFAAGPHRCVGSHLARRELVIAVEEGLNNIPRFRVESGQRAVSHSVGVFGLHGLPLQWAVEKA